MKQMLATILLLATSLVAAEVKDAFPDFGKLNWAAARVVARKQAEADFAAGTYRILVYGFTGGGGTTYRHLAGARIEVKGIAGCIVSDGITEGAEVYNEVMRKKLYYKFGKDVSNETHYTKSKK